MMLLPTASCATTAANGAQWHALIASIFGSVDLDVGDRGRFYGQIRRNVLGDIELNEVLTSYEDAKRTRSNISADMKEYFVLVIPRAGGLQLTQNNMECTVSPGTLALFYLNAPYRYFHNDEARVLDLKVPASMLRARVSQPDRLCATAIRADVGVPRITLDFVAAMADELFDIPADRGIVHAGLLVDAIARLIDAERVDLDLDRAASHHAIRARCKALIETNIGDPDLGPALLAARCGISKRYVHAVFHEVDETVGECIRNRRLSLCHDRLRRNADGKLQIKDIALSTGFRSVAHFCNAFKARYGIAASDLPRDGGRAEAVRLAAAGARAAAVSG